MTTQRPTAPRVPARGGTRRMETDLRTLFGNQMRRDDAERVLEDDEAVSELASSATVLLWDGKHVLENAFTGLGDVELAPLHPVRRIGTHHKARSKFAYHATQFGGHSHLVLAESLLEAAWLRQFDRRAQHWGYIGQPAVVRWQYGSKTLIHIPDVLGQDIDHHHWFADIRYSDGMDTFTGRVMDRLMRETCRQTGTDYEIFTDMKPERRANLSVLAMRRWRNPVTVADWWPDVDKSRPATMMWLTEAAGGGPVGLSRAIRVVAQCHADIKLSEPISMRSRLTWRSSNV